jgi:hypothetical protein
VFLEFSLLSLGELDREMLKSLSDEVGERLLHTNPRSRNVNRLLRFCVKSSSSFSYRGAAARALPANQLNTILTLVHISLQKFVETEQLVELFLPSSDLVPRLDAGSLALARTCSLIFAH